MESKVSSDIFLTSPETPARNFWIHRGIPLLTLVNGILMSIPAGFLLQDALESFVDDGEAYQLLRSNVIATTSIAILVAVFQMLISASSAMKGKSGMKGWYTCHIAISALLAVTSIFAFSNDLHKTYTGFTFTYTCILDSAFSLGLAVLLMLPE